MNTSIASYNMSSFNFSFQTSSGDSISLDLYSRDSLEYSKTSSRGLTSKELTLTRERGMELHYEGNGLDEQDKKEIAKALKQVQDILNQFLSPKEVQQNSEKTSKKILDIVSPLKEPQNREKTDYLKGSLTDIFDEMFKSKQNDKEILQTLDDIFKNVLEEFDPFEFYA